MHLCDLSRVRLATQLSARLSAHLPFCPSVCTSVRLHVRSPACLSTCLPTNSTLRQPSVRLHLLVHESVRWNPLIDKWMDRSVLRCQLVLFPRRHVSVHASKDRTAASQQHCSGETNLSDTSISSIASFTRHRAVSHSWELEASFGGWMSFLTSTRYGSGKRLRAAWNPIKRNFKIRP